MFNKFFKKTTSQNDYYVVIYSGRAFIPVDAESDFTDEALCDVILYSRILRSMPFSGRAGIHHDGDTVYIKLLVDNQFDFLSCLKGSFPLEAVDQIEENVFTVGKDDLPSPDIDAVKNLTYRYKYF